MSQLVYDKVSPLERGRDGSLASQVELKLRVLVETGLVRPGERLPPTRELAERMGVNRGAVLKAIRRLEAEGLVAARVGSGVTVVGGASAPEPGSPADPPRFSSALRRLTAHEPAADGDGPVLADLSRLAPDPAFFPVDEFVGIFTEACRREQEVWQYASPYGHPILRRQIAERLAEAGAPWAAEDVLITSGAQQGLDLLFKAFVDPGDPVAVESPTYPGILALLRFSGADVVEIPVVARGRDLSGLLSRSVRVVYTMPERHNPTGGTLGEGPRRALLAAAAGAVVIEDGYEPATSGLAPLSALDRRRVVTIGSFSKELAPGFRVGWIAADSGLLRAIALVKQTADLQTPLPLQAAIAEFLGRRRDRDLRRLRTAEIDARAGILKDSLARHLPDIAFRGGERGSALFWLELPPGVSGRAVARRARERGIRVSPGADFDPRGRDLPALRISVSRVERGVLEEAVSRLAVAISQVKSQPGMAAAIPTI
jgi:GntR family transcriptional regulator/MocR family aminotransferase